MEQGLPVTVNTENIKQPGLTIHYPSVSGLPSQSVQKKINDSIIEAVGNLVSEQHEKQDTEEFEEMIGSYEIKNNSRNLLSITLTNYAYAKYHAHGLTIMKALTFDTETGQQFELKDLFNKGTAYLNYLKTNIEWQSKAREIPLLTPSISISPNQDFYIADKTIVLFFNAYELAPYYYGIPVFPISVFSIKPLINTDGPLERLATNP